jgi:hypothetical protein
MKRESLVIAIGAPILVGFALFKLVPGSASPGVLSGSAIMILVNLTTLKGTASIQFQEKQTFLEALDRLMAGRGWRRKTTQSDDLMYRAPLPVSLFVADLDVNFSAANTATLSGPQWLVRGLEAKLGKT